MHFGPDAAYDNATAKIHFIKSDNQSLHEFLKVTNHSFVFFGSKSCGHCRKLTPFWLQFQEWADVALPDVAVRKVECANNYEFCTNENIKGFPTLFFYHYLERFDKECMATDLEGLQKCAILHMGSITAEYERLKKLAAVPDPIDNIDGKLIHLEDATIDSVLNDQPWLIMLHAYPYFK